MCPSRYSPPMMAAFALLSLTWISFAEVEGGTLRLIMVEEVGCRFCLAWDADVGIAHPKTKEGAFAPLLRVKRDAPEVAAFAPIVYTPTFIVARGRK